MKAEYDFSKARRGAARQLPPAAVAKKHSKVRITTMVDADVLESFKTEASKAGSLPYQTRINQVLRAHVDGDKTAATALVEDDGFIARIAERLSKYAGPTPTQPQRKGARSRAAV